MTLQDPKNTTKTLVVTIPKNYVDTDPTGAEVIAVDTKGYRFARFDIITGTITGGTAWTATLQQSSDNGSSDAYANIESSPTAKTQVSLADANDSVVKSFVVDLTAVERYLKLSWANTGTWSASNLAATCTLFGPCDTAFLGSEVGGFYP